ncbi:hypothetical protein CBI38_37380 (plasmid) [Rhodococcus oxybenzonivorans]|uniref:Uncharacterized protein n=1 Tax=Rhodococcus oxybenzonivorans TaxID=1990687 RepID=A0A2S2C875_9NOCA|nr:MULTISPECIES: hypothetical protein [Rhodococcus]AWK77061.1 hypothetical protein CBI38_37380 [Rhodococcus oxybenzonivorans]QTJ71263.1 hypothetical protein HYG77_38095 [Rhodococcus sp. ZPP]
MEAATGHEPTMFYPSGLVDYRVGHTTERVQMLATHDPIVDAEDWERSIGQLLDWFLRTGPVLALTLLGQTDCAQVLRDLPEVHTQDVLKRPALLRKYDAALTSGKEVMEAAARDRRRPYDSADPLAASSSPLGESAQLTQLVQDVHTDAYKMLVPTRSKAGLRAGNLLAAGLISADLGPELTAESYAHEIDMDLRIAFWERVDSAFWVPRRSIAATEGRCEHQTREYHRCTGPMSKRTDIVAAQDDARIRQVGCVPATLQRKVSRDGG